MLGQWEILDSLEKTMAEDTKTRTSVITKAIKRTIQTAQYESLVIEHSIEETIEWSTPSERAKKMQNWETLLLQEFKLCHDRVLDGLGLCEKRAFFKNPSESTKAKYQPLIEAKKSETVGSKLQGIDLDNLDTLGA